MKLKMTIDKGLKMNLQKVVNNFMKKIGSVQLSVSVLISIQSLMFPEGVCLEAVGRRANPLGNGFLF